MSFERSFAMLMNQRGPRRDEDLDQEVHDDDGPVRRTRYFPSTLDEPITDVSFDLIRRSLGLPAQQQLSSKLRLGSLTSAISALCADARVSKNQVSVVNSNMVYEFITWIQTEFVPDRTANELDARLVASTRRVLGQVERAIDRITGIHQDDPRGGIRDGVKSESELIYEQVYVKLQTLVWASQRTALNGLSDVVGVRLPGHHGDWIVRVTRDVGLISSGTTGHQVVPASVVMGLHNVAHTRWATLVANRVTKSLATATIVQVFEWQRFVISGGNDEYETVKMLESYGRTRLSAVAPGSSPFKTAPSERLLAKVEERAAGKFDPASEAGRTHSAEEFARAVRSGLENLFEPAGLRETAEIFGLQKTIGYPVVNVRSGGAKVHQGASQGVGPDTFYALRSEWILCHLILRNYISRTGSWPRLVFLEPGTTLEELMKTGSEIDDSKYPLHDWSKTVFTKIYEFNSYPDMSPFVLDKACSPGFVKAEAAYRGTADASKDRRVVTATLTSRDMTSKTLLESWRRDEYDCDRDLGMSVNTRKLRASGMLAVPDRPEDRPLVILKPKEKEFKIAPRMYCLLEAKHRFPLGIIQENVKSGPFRDLPYQTMSLGRVDQQLALWETTSPPPFRHTGKRKARVYIEIDYSAWNNKFRDSLISRYGARFDQMFGVTNMFGKVHKYFAASNVAIECHGLRVPLFEPGTRGKFDGETCWWDHDGGIEGIDQATWTAATIAMVYCAVGLRGLDFVLLGQGDNQIVAIDLDLDEDDHREVKKQAGLIMLQIDLEARTLRHDAKPDEFVESTSVLTYSKQIFVHGAEYPTQLKYASRIGPFSKAERASEAELIGALSSSASTAAERFTDPMDGYRIYMTMLPVVARALARSSPSPSGTLGKWISSARDDQLEVLWVLPSPLGGLPTSGPTAFMARGEPDSLGSAVASLRFLKQGGSTVWSRWFSLSEKPDVWRPLAELADTQYSSLLADPEGLPLRKLAGGEEVVAEAARSAIRASTLNPDYAPIVQADVAGLGPRISAAISTMDPFFPHIASDLFSLSLPGVVEKVIKKFSYSRTISTLSRSDPTFGNRALKADDDALRTTLLMVVWTNEERPSTDESYSTTFALSEHLRTRWGKRIEGVSSSHPIDYDVSWDTEGHGFKLYYPRATPENPLFDRGSERPYLGSSTDDRVESKPWEVKNTSGVEDLKKLVTMLTSPGMRQTRPLIEMILRTRGSANLDEAVRLLPTVVGGSVAHRYVGLNRNMRSGPTGTINCSTHVRFHTDDVPGFSGSKQDWPVAVAHYFAHLIWLFRTYTLRRGAPPKGVTIVFNLDGLKPLERHAVTVGSVPALSLIRTPSPLVNVVDPEMNRSYVRPVTLPPVYSGDVPRALRLAAVLLTDLAGPVSPSDQVEAVALSRTPSGLGVPECAELTPDDIVLGLCSVVYHVSLTKFLNQSMSLTREDSLNLSVRLRDMISETASQAVALVVRPLESLPHLRRALGLLSTDPTANDDRIDDLVRGVTSVVHRQALTGGKPTVPPIVGHALSIEGSTIVERLMPAVWSAVRSQESVIEHSERRTRPTDGLGGTLTIVGSIKVLFDVITHRDQALTIDRRHLREIASVVVRRVCFRSNRAYPVTYARIMEKVTGAIRELSVFGESSGLVVRSLRTSSSGTSPGRRPVELSAIWTLSDTGLLIDTQLDATTDKNHYPFNSGVIDRPEDAVSVRTRDVSYLRKIGCSAGAASSTLELLIPVVSDLGRTHVPINVIGTGQGGCQTAFGLVGRRSYGYDLRTALSRKQLCDEVRSAPEVRNFGLSSIAPLASDPVINWFDTGARKVERVINAGHDLLVDIEVGSRRPMDLVLGPFSRYDPVTIGEGPGPMVTLKYLANRSDVAGVLSRLNSITGPDGRPAVENLTYRVVGPCLCEDHRSHVWVSFLWVRRFSARTSFVETLFRGKIVAGLATFSNLNPSKVRRALLALPASGAVMDDTTMTSAVTDLPALLEAVRSTRSLSLKNKELYSQALESCCSAVDRAHTTVPTLRTLAITVLEELKKKDGSRFIDKLKKVLPTLASACFDSTDRSPVPCEEVRHILRKSSTDD